MVLVTHYWVSGSLTFGLACNELALLLIGTGTGILVNSYMRNITGLIRRDQSCIDRAMRTILLAMSDRLSGHTERPRMDFTELQNIIKEALARAKAHENNALWKQSRYYTEFVKLRRDQCALLQNMMSAVEGLAVLPEQSALVADLLVRVAVAFHRLDNAGALLEEVEACRAAFRASPLPHTREEFEARALLYQTVRDLTYLLKAKKRFADQLTEDQIRDLWPEALQDCTAETEI